VLTFPRDPTGEDVLRMHPQAGRGFLTRRAVLKTMAWAPTVFLVAPFQGMATPLVGEIFHRSSVLRPSAGFHVSPRYPEKSPLDDFLRLVTPGLDEYITEKYAFEITETLNAWSRELIKASPALQKAAELFARSIEACSLRPAQEVTLRSSGEMEVLRRSFKSTVISGRDRFVEEIQTYFAEFSGVETAEFLIVAIAEGPSTSSPVRVDIRYDLVGMRNDARHEERIGLWRTQWVCESSEWRAVRWETVEETVSRVRNRFFSDITIQALGQAESYKSQLLRGADYWRTVLDSASGIDVYGNNGLAVGDIDNDGFDDLYICQPPGLPNRLYRNRGDGTFEDVTEKSGLGLLDGTACALFADFENKGLQDLLVVCGAGPQLFMNQGNGKFQRKRDAFRFAQPPQGTFTQAAVADYDGDGRLDVYFCLYSYYLALDQYHYPAPYFDARNGPPNFLMHNEGNATFQDRTQAAGLNVENDRYSFACAWGDYTSDGRPSLYVANDFGRNNLYRNNGDGTFTAVSEEARVNDVGAGMSVAWFDFDNDGRQDIYVSNMWSAAGLRVSQQPKFHEMDAEDIRALYRQHARGNSLYRNLGNGQFQNVSAKAGVQMGRWAWGSDAWDFDHDGFSDLYVANGYISGSDPRHLGSFFWRQVVGKSPSTSTASPNYERGWNAINELIRSDCSWSGYERNVLYLNNRDGTFSEVSGALGMDFPDDSRTFVLADLDHDGRLELILKNRNAPQLRVLRNGMREIGHSIIFRLRGQKSNRDGIGAAVSVEANGHRQTKYLQSGSGFLAQHTKELLFGMGDAEEAEVVTVRWPSGLAQVFEHIPANQRVEIQEGSDDFLAHPFADPPASWAHSGDFTNSEPLPSSVETWLLQPLRAPDFSLVDLDGNLRDFQSFRGSFVFLTFWSTLASDCREQLRSLHHHWKNLNKSSLLVVGVNVDDPVDLVAIKAFVAKEQLLFPTLLATPEVVGVYNILYRYLFDRHRDLPVPASFLIDASGMIAKVYQGPVTAEQIFEDLTSAPRTEADRVQKALPFPGLLPENGFQRNNFTYGVALFQHGYLEQAAASFKQVIASEPDSPEAYYNLGTLCLRTNKLPDARRYLEQAVQLRPEYPEAWNNLGMIAAEQGQSEEAINHFKHSLSFRPSYTVALLNLGNLYRRQGNYGEAGKLLLRALELEPDDPEANYSAGMLYARQNDSGDALRYLKKAVSLRPDYPDALNNMGVLLAQTAQYNEAEEEFRNCIRVAPSFDQPYLNLARLYVLQKNEQKAKEVLQELLRLQPGHKMAQQALQMLN
jgi:tetratricopeptide (TPR) repeat protein/peroxiredoxin